MAIWKCGIKVQGADPPLKVHTARDLSSTSVRTIHNFSYNSIILFLHSIMWTGKYHLPVYLFTQTTPFGLLSLYIVKFISLTFIPKIDMSCCKNGAWYDKFKSICLHFTVNLLKSSFFLFLSNLEAKLLPSFLTF